jgi:peptidyl-prolyl cis-trans isomerase B (cyclophilin B)
MRRRLVMVAMLGALVAGRAQVWAQDATPSAKENPMVLLTTSLGDVKVELFPDKAPVTVKNFLDYVRAGYYDGTVFHRVIPGFMIQGGGMDAELREKAGQRPAIKNESTNGLPNVTGSLSMARTSVPDSATSQFFINVADNDFLNRDKSRDGVGYAVFGKVVEGMDVVKKIEAVKTATKGPHQNVPVEPVVLTSAKVVEEKK